MRYRVGIIGLGGVGEVLLQAFLNHSMTDVICIFDADKNRLDEISKKYNLDTTDNYESMLLNSSIDLIYLAVPPKFHHPIAIDIIKSGKHIFCEKPLANSLVEAKEMVESLKNSSVKDFMNFPTIYRPAFLKLQEYIKDGLIGEIKEIRLNANFKTWPRPWQTNSWISSRDQGGFVKEVFPHFLHMMMLLAGEVKIEKSQINYPENPNLSEISISVKGNANHIPIFLTGEINNEQEEEICFHIIGSKGTLTLYNWKELLLSHGGNKEYIDIPSEDHLIRIIDSIIKSLQGYPSTIVTFEDGLKIQEMLEILKH